MRLTLFNGSPRRKGSNTKILLEHFIRGFEEEGGSCAGIHYLHPAKDVEAWVSGFGEADNVLIAFPLYTDAMPAPVMTFIEALESLCGREGNPRLGFLVQSGFPEAFHSRFVERYLEKLSRRLGCEYFGTIVKGGVEGIQSMPEQMTRKLFTRFYELGKHFAKTGQFDEHILRKLATPERLKGFGLLMTRLFFKPISRMYWNSQLKKNNAYDKRFARPYQT